MVSLLYQEYEWNYSITVIKLGFLGITFGFLRKPSLFNWRKLKILLSRSFEDGCLLTRIFQQSPGIRRTMLKDAVYLDSALSWLCQPTTRVCVCACVRACVCVCVCARVRARTDGCPVRPRAGGDRGSPLSRRPVQHPRTSSICRRPASCSSLWLAWEPALPCVLLASSLSLAFWLFPWLAWFSFSFHLLFGDALI